MSTKDDLMSSLMGGGGGEQDLFGDLPDVTTTAPTNIIHNESPPPIVGATLPPAPPPAVPTSAPPAAASSFLSASGLLGTTAPVTGDGGGGGLFDAIDEQEEQDEAKKLREEQERRQQEEQQKQQLLEQQQMQDQMQSIHLGPSPAATAAYPNQMMQQQQPNQQQMPPHMMMQGSQMQPSSSYMQPQQQQQPYMQQQQQPMQNSYMQQSQMQQSQMQQQQQPMMQQSHMDPQQQSQMQQPTAPIIHSQPPPYTNSTSVMPQQSVQPPMQQSQNGFYRDHTQQQQQQPVNGSRFYQAPQGSVTAGMHGVGGTGGPMMNTASAMLRQPQVPPPAYQKVTVLEPLLLGSPTILGIGQPPHWSYHVAAQLRDGTVWAVRRRFRHVVALEDRMRDECPGAILPPRPDKHATRAIEEASAHQSAEFAVQRAAELQFYLNQMITHPHASASVALRLFLSLQDDLGIAWPEVSNNALTRLANASVGAAVKVSETTTASMQNDAGEDSAELLALQNAESIRMGAVLQAVPKLEGAVTLLREQAEMMLSVGMEFSRVAKEVPEAQPMDIASSGLLRAGRRSKRMVMELSAAMQSYSHHYKLCRYERMAFSDRRAAILRRHKERHRADTRAQVMMQQRHHHHNASSAAMMDDMATDAGQECEEIGQRLKSEIHRISEIRRVEWSNSVKIVASAMKEALSERVAIWETVQETFLQNFPEYKETPQTQAAQP